ncbi:hypothetical protein BGX31_008089 [Mortierella sp. GBA43]|nr:hypothetical protein BGX31_008089 [Mortierella sp. GBA43]
MKGQAAKGDAFESYLKQLRGVARSLGGGDDARTIASSSEMALEEAAQNALSSILLVLLELSESPTALRRGEETYTVPETLRGRKIVIENQEEIDRQLLQTILKEDPLTGDHWKFQIDSDDDESDGSDGSGFEDRRSSKIVSNTKDETQVPDAAIAPSEKGETTPALHGFDLWRQLSLEHSQSLLPLRELERRQYWRGINLISRERATKPRSDQVAYDIQCATELNATLRDSSKFTLPYSAPVMDELDTINEIFLLLQGLPTIIFSFQDGVAKQLSTEVAVTHLSPGALEAIIRPFMERAGEIAQLQTALDNIFSAPANVHGKIVQTFASALHSEFLEVKAFLIEKQRLYQKCWKGHDQRTASLIELQAILSEKLNTVHVLLSFLRNRQFYNSKSGSQEQACSFGMDILSGLFESMCEFELSGDTSNATLFLRLMQQSIQPFLLNLECWLSGQPLDSGFEFPIKT